MTTGNVRSGFAPINGAQVYYEVAGEGQTIVFIHAGVADSRLWDDQFSFFAEHYRVIRYDLRAFGKTEPVEGEFSNLDDLYELLKFLGVERAHLVGCSIGGGLCMDLALRHPEMAASLVMVCSGPSGLDLDVPTPEKFAEAEKAWHAKDWDLLAELETQIWFDGAGRAPQDVDPALRQKAFEMNRIGILHAAKELGKAKPAPTPSAAERLGELNLPVLVIVGALDTPYILAAADYMTQRVKNAQKVVIENTAHLPSMEHPAEFNHLLAAFLESTEKA
jgi:pimeloyl-ACP methyl ester carboxylesterase